MGISYRRPVGLVSLIVVVVMCWGAGAAHAQPPFYRAGAAPPPVRDPRLTTDNGIPGSGYYYYRDYPYPSLREALQEYGLFGRRFRKRMTDPSQTRIPGNLPSPR